MPRRLVVDIIKTLLPAGRGRVAAIYTDPAAPSYDECIALNMAAIAAGRPQDCVLFSAPNVPVTYPVGAGQGKHLLLDRSGAGHHQSQPTASARGEFSRRINQLTGTEVLATQSIVAIATQYRLFFGGEGTITLSGAASGTLSAGSHTIACTAGTLTLTVAGSVQTADLRFEADATVGLPAYQRVTTAADYDEAGYRTYWRASTDDWASTRINPAGAVQFFGFFAAQKMSDAAAANLFELSVNQVTQNGSVRVTFPTNTGGQNTFFSRGTVARGTNQTVTAPTRSAILADGNTQAPRARLNINLFSPGGTFADQGGGTYLEHDAFFGCRAGTGMFVNMREFAPPLLLFMQPGDLLTDAVQLRLLRNYASAMGVTV